MHRLLLAALLATAGMQASPAIQTVSAATPSKPSGASAAKKTPAPAAAAGKNLGASPAASDAVITIHGLCGNQAAASGNAAATCTMVVTKRQFDRVLNGLNAIGPQLLPMQRRSVAEGYTATLLNYEAAKKAGVERDPRFADVMRLARMRAMGDMYNALQQEQAKKVSPQEIETYYKNNPEKFEELTMRRMVLPRYNSANLKDDIFVAKARQLAEEMHDRAAKGEDLDKLQKEAADSLGIKDTPSTRMGPVRRGIFSPDQEKQLFALQPGKVTGIIEQPSAFIIFKLEGRETLTPEKARDEIVGILVKQNMEKQQQTRDRSVRIEYNEQYVGPANASAWMPANQLKARNEGQVSDSKGAGQKSEAPK